MYWYKCPKGDEHEFAEIKRTPNAAVADHYDVTHECKKCGQKSTVVQHNDVGLAPGNAA